jgi:hypothetical protein
MANDTTPSTNDAPLLSADEIGAKLHISGRCVLNWLYEDVIPAAIRQGKVIRFREADVMNALDEARKQQGNPLAQDSAVRLGLWLVAPDVVDRPSWLLMRDPTDQEKQGAALIVHAHENNLKGIESHMERRAYIEGALDAAEWARNPPPLEPDPA